ncbi:hypothetical protein SD37_00775 [Amycolatopsis orientalis]|uniref:Pentapeptide repeat-containing protein n=1 Tax=Amycolatopsis orientalis TaxID=31958 RepID=A0A193BQ54_AMYOR|nr:hypothetical protein [Amycolatopsis orientalis]ANN14331.1 hypothetical protein SD37_00775 [Amycolatopsis orientalis]
MWTWLGRGDPRVLGGATAALVLVILTIGRIRRLRRRRTRDGLRLIEPWRHKPITGAVLQWMALALVVAGAVGAALLWLLGFPSLPSATSFGTTEVLELLKIALAVVAGLGGVVLLAVNLRKQRVAESEHLLAQAKDERERAQGFNERFGTAAEQLAHENAAVRLAGLYAMAGLADDWVTNRQICVDVLCGYLRLPVSDDASERKVRESVLRVLRDRLGEDWRGNALDLDLTGTTFTEPIVMDLATTGRLSYDEATFERGVFRIGPRNASAVTYRGAEFRNGEFRFENGDTFSDVRFSGRLVFDSDRSYWGRFLFKDCDFSDATFVITGHGEYSIRARFENCTFSECVFDYNGIIGLDHRDFFITNSTLTGGTFSLHGLGEDVSVLWISESRIENMRFDVEENREGPVKSIHLNHVEVVATELPERYVRRS